MGEQPIIFSGPMIRALLDGRKTMTRRVVKPRGKRRPSLFDGEWADSYVLDPGNAEWRAQDVPYAVGDVLWVRENWTHVGVGVWTISAARMAGRGGVRYQADGRLDGAKFWPSIHLPREFSRITLNVTGVKVERLNDISEEDAIAEGVPYDYCEHIHGPGGYRDIWEKIHGPGSWEANPWVVAISFELATPTGTNR